MEQGVDRDEAQMLLQGVLLYRGNRLVRRLEGRFADMQEQARLISDLISEREQYDQAGLKAEQGEVRLGKRTFS